MEQSASMDPSGYAEIIAIFVLVLGVFLAYLARRVCTRGLELLDARMAQHATSEQAVLSPTSIRIMAGIVFWLVVAVTVFVVLRIVGVGGFSVMLDDLVLLIPKLIISITIVGAGHLAGLLGSHLISRISSSIAPGSLVPRFVHASILLVAVVMALQQLHIDITFFTQLLLVGLAIGSGGLVLAFALGARRHVANLIARSELQRYSVGDRIRIDDCEGTIVEIHKTGLDMVTDAGVESIPAARFSETHVLRLPEADEEHG